MKSFLVIILTIGLSGLMTFGNPNNAAMDHNSWNNLLNTYVSNEGNVDYLGFKKDKSQLETYLQLLSANIPDDSWTENEKLAYWINAYNAFTVSLIVEHYPIKSIMDIKNAWDIKFIELGDQTYSLNEIEHEIIRKEFNEPRIHFVLVCAAVSCPVLLNEAYAADQLEQQLQQQGVRFINDPSKNFIKTKKAKVSQLFNWFADDFTKNGSIIDYLNQFSTIKLEPNATIDFLAYNWDLNE
jgi:hypothetical protein